MRARTKFSSGREGATEYFRLGGVFGDRCGGWRILPQEGILYQLAKGLAFRWPTETENPLRSPHTEVPPGEFRISIAIPLHNEEGVIPELFSRLEKSLISIEGGPHEIELVYDGSTDSTAAALEEAA